MNRVAFFHRGQKPYISNGLLALIKINRISGYFGSSMKKNRGIVAAGHQETARSACEMLRAGGNAFDASLAAMLTACVVEPVLASPGGSG